MSHISTEQSAIGRALAEPPSGDSQTSSRAFRIAIVSTIATLAMLCALFLVLGYIQGPKLASAQVDSGAVIVQGDQQLRLFANQPVAQVSTDQVSISPATPFSVSTEGDIISVQFRDRLDYSTEYSVSVQGVTSSYLPQASTLNFSFVTDAPSLFFLDRGEPDDQIVSTGLSGPDRAIAFTGRHIQDFRPLLNSVAVVSLADDHSSTLDLVSLRDGVTEHVNLPDTVSISALDAATSGTVIGFTLSSTRAGIAPLNSNTLYAINMDAGRVVAPVLGLNGEPLNVLGWQFIPGTPDLLALSIDRSLLRVTPASGEVVPLGQFSEFGRVSADGSVVTMVDSAGTVALNLTDGRQRRLTASPVLGLSAYLGSTVVLTGGDRIEKVVVPDDSGTRFSSLLVYDDGRESRILYQTVDGQGSITDFSVSPNGQFVAVETVPNAATSVSDGYFFDAKSTSVTTIIVDVATGSQARSFEGFATTW